MKRQSNEAIVSFVMLIILVFMFQGVTGVFEFIKNMWLVFSAMLIALNQASLELSGDTVLVLLFSTTITFAVVGILLELWNIPRGKFERAFGKLAFWVVGFPVAFVLNIIGRVMF